MSHRDHAAELEQVSALHERFSALVSDLAADGAEERGHRGTWSVKDAVAHVARWDELKLREIAAELSGTAPAAEPDYRVLNARWLAEDADLPISVARERLATAHEAYRSLLQSLSDEQWASLARRHVEWTIAHYERHVRAPLEFDVAPGG